MHLEEINARSIITFNVLNLSAVHDMLLKLLPNPIKYLISGLCLKNVQAQSRNFQEMLQT